MPFQTVNSISRSASRLTATAALVLGLVLPALAQTEYVSGLPHTALGSATLGLPVDRRLPVQNLGSSGQDGVEIDLHSRFGGGAAIDLAPVLATPGSEIRIRPKGWDGTIKGNIRLTGTGGGVITETQNFALSGATALDWRVLGVDGKILRQGSVASPAITYELSNLVSAKIDCFSMNGAVMENRNTDVVFNSVFTVSGLGGPPITTAHEVIVTPRTCLGCPPPFVDLQSVIITSVGIPSFDVLDTRLRTFSSDCYGVGGAQISEQCTPVCCSGDCDDDDRRLMVTNIGSSGQDGVSIDNIGSQGSENGSLKDRIAVSVSFSGTSLAPHIPIEMAMKGKGHVTLLKLYDDEDQAIGARSVRVDASPRGSTECVARCYNAAGDLLATATLSSAAAVSGPGCPGGPSPTYTLDDDGMLTYTPCVRPWTCTLGGALVSNVDRVTFTPLNPTVAASAPNECVITGTDLAAIVVEDVSVKDAVSVSGLPHIALGAATFDPPAGRRLPVHNLGSSGQDGVEIKLRSMWGGGTSVDITPLLGPSPAARTLRVRYKGWDGTIKGRVTATFNPDGSLSEEYDFSAIDAASLHWHLYDEHHELIAGGIVGGPVLSWTVDVPSSGAECNKLFAARPGPGGGGGGGSGGSAVVRRADQGFFDIAVSVRVGGPGSPPIDGVHYLEVEPDPCAGLPENCPPGWTDVQSLVITTDGIPDLTLLDAHLGTFGATCSGIRDSQVGEVCDDGNSCDENERRLSVSNLGSSGQDGVAIDLGDGATGGQMLRSKRCPDCPPGHVTLIKFVDDVGETFRLSSAESPTTGAVTLTPDALGVGATAVRGSFRNALGAELSSVVLANGESISHPPCAVGAATSVRWSGLVYIYGGCGGTTDYTLPGGAVVGGVASVHLLPLSPTTPRSASQVQITSDDPDGFELHGVTIKPRLRGDMNCDDATNNFDIDAFVLAILNAADYWAAYPECNRANGDIDNSGATNNFDIDPFVECILNSGCP